MLRLTLEMVPFGDEERKYQIGEIVIANTGGTHEIGNYSVLYWNGRKGSKGTLMNEDKHVYIDKYDRSKGAWKLAIKAIRGLGL